MMVAQIAKGAGTAAAMKVAGIDSRRMVVSEVIVGIARMGRWLDGGIECGT